MSSPFIFVFPSLIFPDQDKIALESAKSERKGASENSTQTRKLCSVHGDILGLEGPFPTMSTDKDSELNDIFGDDSDDSLTSAG